MKTLQISATTVTHIAKLSADLNIDTTDESNVINPFSKEGFASVQEHTQNPNRKSLFQAIDDLPLHQKQELEAIALLGRGSFTGFDQAFQHAAASDEKGITTYISAKPLHKYLPQGVEHLGKLGYTLSE